MAALDPRIEAIRVKYGLDGSDFWELPQKKGTWVAKHSALEVAAAKAGIEFDNPIIIEANSEAGIAAIGVAASMYENVPGDSEDGKGYRRELRREWATGEASPKNNKNAYPWAMAEKRAKDRVILKLIGIHGLVYSEDEMAGSGADRPNDAPAAPVQISSYLAKKILKTDAVLADIDTAKTLKRCDELEAMMTAELAFLPGNWIDAFRERIRLRRVDLSTASDAPNPAETANAALDRQFSETIGK